MNNLIEAAAVVVIAQVSTLLTPKFIQIVVTRMSPIQTILLAMAIVCNSDSQVYSIHYLMTSCIT
jgi:hypothetical protein